jgi:NADPH:quinone reductase-like Zn-dependent oxidoreductase
MKLVRLRAPGGLENLRLVEEDHPKPRPGELLVRGGEMGVASKHLTFVCGDGRLAEQTGRRDLSDGESPAETAGTETATKSESCSGGTYVERQQGV